MIYDAIERVYTVLNANLLTDWNALLTSNSLTTIASLTIRKREDAEKMRANGVAFTTPAIGIYGLHFNTNFADGGLGGKRDSLNRISADLVIVGTDGALIQKQVELGAQALVKGMCERVIQGGSLTFGGGIERGSVSGDFESGYMDEQGSSYISLATVTVPIWDREQTT